SPDGRPSGRGGRAAGHGQARSANKGGREGMERDSSKRQAGPARGRRPGSASRGQIGAVSLIAAVVLLGLAGCGGSGPVASRPASSSATSAVTGQSTAGSPSAPAATGAQRAAVPEPAHTVVVVME